MKKIAAIFGLAAVSFALASCDRDPAPPPQNFASAAYSYQWSDPRCAGLQNPGECSAWVDAGGDYDDYLLAGMAGYYIATRGGYSYIERDPRYRGPERRLKAQIRSRDAQISALQAKVARQKQELRRQQAARSNPSPAPRMSSPVQPKPTYSSTPAYRPTARPSTSSYRSSGSSSGHRSNPSHRP